jgi:hypothetical protein
VTVESQSVNWLSTATLEEAYTGSLDASPLVFFFFRRYSFNRPILDSESYRKTERHLRAKQRQAGVDKSPVATQALIFHNHSEVKILEHFMLINILNRYSLHSHLIDTVDSTTHLPNVSIKTK